jgi:hypothetical protein
VHPTQDKPDQGHPEIHAESDSSSAQSDISVNESPVMNCEPDNSKAEPDSDITPKQEQENAEREPQDENHVVKDHTEAEPADESPLANAESEQVDEDHLSPAEPEVPPSREIPPARVLPPQVVIEQPRAAMSRRALNQPAWKTEKAWSAVIEPPKPAQPDPEIVVLEKRIDALVLSVQNLDRQIESQSQLRDELRRAVGCSEPSSIQPVRVAIPTELLETGQRMNAPPPPPSSSSESSSRFVVECEKRRDVPLGLQIAFDKDKRAFSIAEVKSAGCIPEWNRQARQPVQVGDFIVEVNTVRNDVDAMLTELRSSRIRLVIERPDRPMPPPPPRVVPPPAPPKPVATSCVNPNAWPRKSVEAYDEILTALANKKSETQPRTGIMKYGDVPVHVPDSTDGSFRCDLCRVSVPNEQKYVEHFKSAKHESQREQISTPDLWSKFRADNCQVFWYEHTVGMWSIDDPSYTGTGSHTIVSHR